MSADRQRLIYAGHILKDNDTLLDCKIANGSTVYMAKGAPKGNKNKVKYIYKKKKRKEIMKLTVLSQSWYSHDKYFS